MNPYESPAAIEDEPAREWPLLLCLPITMLLWPLVSTWCAYEDIRDGSELIDYIFPAWFLSNMIWFAMVCLAIYLFHRFL